MPVVTDTFTRADGALGSNWAKQFGSGGDLQIVSNAVGVSAPDVHCLAFWNANRFADNQYSEVRVTNQIDAWTGVILRADNVVDRCYLGFLFRGISAAHGGTFDGVMIQVRWDGVYTELAFLTDPSWVLGDVLGLRVTGATHPITLTLYKNGVSVLTWTSPDSSFVRSGGSPGIAIYSPTGKTLRLDDWTGSDSGAGSLTPTARDNFDRANGTLGANWTPAAYNQAALKVVSNTCGATTDGVFCDAFWSADTFLDNQFAQFRMSSLPSAGGSVGVILRAEAAVDKMYAVLFQAPSQVQIYARWLGSFFQLGSTITLPGSHTIGDLVKVTVEGTTHPYTIKIYRNGALLNTFTSSDGTYAKSGGSPGIIIFSPAGQNLTLDEWEGGYMPSTVVTAPPVGTGLTASSVGLVGQYQKHFA